MSKPNKNLTRRSFLRRSGSTTASVILLGAGLTFVNVAKAADGDRSSASPGDTYQPDKWGSGTSATVSVTVTVDWIKLDGSMETVLSSQSQTVTIAPDSSKSGQVSIGTAPSGTTHKRVYIRVNR